MLAVAGLAMADQSVGHVPLVICGDVHERTEHEKDGTRLLTVGSTGATGLGSFTVRSGRTRPRSCTSSGAGWPPSTT